MKNGVLFLGKPWSYDNSPNVKWSNCFVAGELIANAEEKCWSKPKIKLPIRYHRNGFLNCYVYKGSGRSGLQLYEMAKSLQENDYIIGIGTYKEHTYYNKQHELKTSFEAELEMIIPMALIIDPRAYTDIMTAISDGDFVMPTPSPRGNAEDDEADIYDGRETDNDGDIIPDF